MNCTKCDTPLPEGVTFCPNCGARIEGSSSGMPTIAFSRSEQPSPEAPTVAGASTGSPFGLPSSATDQTVAASPFGLPPTTADQPAAASTTRLPSYELPTTQPGYSQPPSYGGYVQPSLPTSTAAIVSLVSGIVAWFMLPVIGAVVAIVAGHMARREISNSNGQLGGSGLATAGLVLGYIQLVLTAMAVCAIIGLLVIGIVASA